MKLSDGTAHEDALISLEGARGEDTWSPDFYV
jgi:hypothetical protein